MCPASDSLSGEVIVKPVSMTMPHAFDQAIVLTPTAVGMFTGATSSAYANRVGPFGGVTAATALNAVL
jgi:hypothetical protein